ncbi:putative UDP-galactose 4-epimerase [Frankia canadensis]|uniref:UDP-glucose 4-epimerase n=1 Tax=Frankia canadensis TaxID=1836972 RepID=A0A2I2KR56_9ACTN|nr:NAD-dependent epimerase/dehydratase family protein [Frankia canadensis]SNQ48142.1 putative UDP-galactose 4-epimerase [Frankia canadensis]SOU55432.1 putative UDP-galactose 4-epimerase [Frankia canadensis]
MRVLVTGASGFIGSVVADALAAAGHAVTAMVRDRGASAFAPGVKVVVADLLDPPTLTAAGVERGFDGVCHLAALTRVRESRTAPLRYFQANLTGTANLLAALEVGTERTGVAPAFVFGSSCAVYGDIDLTGVPESRRPDPSNPYGASKLAAERLLAHQAGTGLIGAVILRSFNVAGAVEGRFDHDDSRIIPAAIAVASGRTEVFRVNGDGQALREYVHVGDMATAYRMALEVAGPGRCSVYNVGSGTGVSVIDVLAAVGRISGHPVRRVHCPPVAEPKALVGDSQRIRTELGWSSPRSGIDQIVADAWRHGRAAGGTGVPPRQRNVPIIT